MVLYDFQCRVKLQKKKKKSNLLEEWTEGCNALQTKEPYYTKLKARKYIESIRHI